MSELRGYDAWKTTPPDDGMDECPNCEGAGTRTLEAHNAHLATLPNHQIECERCEGTGWVERPTREEIREEREERQFDRLHEEGRI